LGWQVGVKNPATASKQPGADYRSEDRDESTIFFKLADCGEEDKGPLPTITQK
jgi:hypothetical protein